MRCFATIALVASLTTSTVNTVASAQNISCNLCGTAKNRFTNHRYKHNNLTCNELQGTLNDLADEDACTAFLTSDKYNWFQYQSFCGCPDVTAPETCQICDDDEMLAFPQHKVSLFDEDEEFDHTCAEAAELARHVLDPNVCANVVATPAVKLSCCRKIGSVCPLCELGGSFNPDKKYQKITCADLEQETLNLDVDQCQNYYKKDSHYWMNWETFCGCENAVVPDEPCTLCGDDLVLRFPDAIVPWEDEPDINTCQEAADLAIHISDEDVCEYEVQTAEVFGVCCGPPIQSEGANAIASAGGVATGTSAAIVAVVSLAVFGLAVWAILSFNKMKYTKMEEGTSTGPETGRRTLTGLFV